WWVLCVLPEFTSCAILTASSGCVNARLLSCAGRAYNSVPSGALTACCVYLFLACFVKITFLGLGVMGFPMAGHLLQSGHELCAFNRTPARADAWLAQYGAEPRASTAPTIAEACDKADVIFSCLGNDDDVREVMLSS